MNQPIPLHSCPASHEPSVVVLGQMGVACLQVFINCIFTICCGWPFINPNNQIQFKSKIHSFGGWGTAHERSVCSEHKAVVCPSITETQTHSHPHESTAHTNYEAVGDRHLLGKVHWTVTESVDYTPGQVPYSGITGA